MRPARYRAIVPTDEEVEEGPVGLEGVNVSAIGFRATKIVETCSQYDLLDEMGRPFNYR
jgi:hypothetical protein